jgi:hypothetical protein
VIGELHSTVLSISKTRLRFLHGLVLEPDPQDPVTPGRQLGRCIVAALGGKPAVPTSPPRVSVPVQHIEPADLKQLWSRINQHGVDHEAFRAYLAHLNVESTKALSPAQLEQCLSEIEARKGQAFQSTDATSDVSAGIRAQLLKALVRLRAEITQAEQNQPPGEPHAQALIDLAQWLPRVARAGDNPQTPQAQLHAYFLEVEQAMRELEQMALTNAAA